MVGAVSTNVTGSVVITDLNFSYAGTRHPALRGIDLRLGPGEVCAVIGPSGAGKSTLCYAIAGFIPHLFRGQMVGQVCINDLDTRSQPLSTLVTQVGLVFQSPLAQMSSLKSTVYDEVAFGLENLGIAPREIRQRVGGMLEQLQLTNLGERSPYRLSAGQQQLVALAAIAVMEPPILVLDEPTSQLDTAAIQQVYEAIDKLARQGKTIVIVENDLEWVARFARRVVVLCEGSVVKDGPTAEILTGLGLEELGLRLPSYISVAGHCRELGLWPKALGLPLSLEEAATSLGKILAAAP